MKQSSNTWWIFFHLWTCRKTSYRRKLIFFNLDDESDIATESEAESAGDTESEESDEETVKKEMKKKSIKPTKAIQRRATMPRRQAASKKPKFEFSSDSSEFENSEDDYQFSDWKLTVQSSKNVFNKRSLFKFNILHIILAIYSQ